MPIRSPVPSTEPPAGAREVLRRLARGADGGLITVQRASELLAIPSREAATQLGRLAGRGWVRRVRRGLYQVLQLESGTTGPVTVEDPWVLAHQIFRPCYIGGWTAIEHWGLSDQLFRPTFVVSAANVRSRSLRAGSVEFRVARVPPRRLVGTSTVWRGRIRVAVSDRERTLADAFVNPGWVGGVRHLADILTNYHHVKERDLKKLLTRLEEAGRGAAAKRAGYLAESLWPDATEFIDAMHRRRSSGIIRLDPSIRSRGHLNKWWGLWVNVSIPA